MKTLADVSGVYLGAICCGIRKDRNDLGYIYVPHAVACAGVVTRNQLRAPCVDHTESLIRSGKLKALIVNSGNANAATGEHGRQAVAATAAKAAELLNLESKNIAVASTGIIGVPLPLDKLLQGLDSLLAERQLKDAPAFSRAILTTDLVEKTDYREVPVSRGQLQVAGVAKGSGMIAPNMATMLAYLVTNAKVSQKKLQELFSKACDLSFNMVSVDTDTSTSDMALLFATGEVDLAPDEEKLLEELVTQSCVELAKQIARDGEGATKLITAKVSGAVNPDQARLVAKNIIDSPLIKTAIHGADPNWGRVAMAVGKDPRVEIEPQKVSIKFGGIRVFESGARVDFDRARVIEELKKPEVDIDVELGVGKFSATAWGCDLTQGYIDINVDYN